MTTRASTTGTVADTIAGTRCAGCGLSKIAGHRFCEDCTKLYGPYVVASWEMTYERALYLISKARKKRPAHNGRQGKRWEGKR